MIPRVMVILIENAFLYVPSATNFFHFPYIDLSVQAPILLHEAILELYYLTIRANLWKSTIFLLGVYLLAIEALCSQQTKTVFCIAKTGHDLWWQDFRWLYTATQK